MSAPPLRLQAYEAIVERLVFRQLLPGQFVTQRELVELCGLPLGPIREAIPRLEADGLIAPLRQRGLQIASIDVRFVRNAYRLRRNSRIRGCGARRPASFHHLPRAGRG